MNQHQRELAFEIVRNLVPEDEFEKLTQIEIHDIGFGYDEFGMERESASLAYTVFRLLYKYWFRVSSAGHEHIPVRGRGLIVPNHSGVLPIDGSMIAVDIVQKLERPRVMRAVIDNFTGNLPFVNVFFSRCGQVVGHRRNFEDLLRNEELVCVFPEGNRGVGKLFSERYKLRRFNVGFIELHLLHRAPIIPVAVIGAEEQAPMLANLEPLARALKFPYFPITPLFPWLGPLGMFPMPVKYYLSYGEPIRFYEEYGPDTIEHPETIRMLADKVQLTIQALIDEGLRMRKSLFRMGFGMGTPDDEEV